MRLCELEEKGSMRMRLMGLFVEQLAYEDEVGGGGVGGLGVMTMQGFRGRESVESSEE